MNKILVPVDGSKESVKAAQQAISMARKTGSSVTFLSVIVQDCNPTLSEAVTNVEEYVQLQGEMTNLKIANAGKMLDDLVESLECTDVETDIKIVIGSPHPEIISTAKSGQYDLILMGARGLNAFKRFFIGSVTKRVIIEAPCSVLVVK
jgi:nucleotide-binding universal stress UspA family protein